MIIPIKKCIVVIFVFLMLFAVPSFGHEDDIAGDGEHGFIEEVSEALGVATLWGLLALNILYYYSMIYRRWPLAYRQTLPGIAAMPLKWKSLFCKYHYWGNPVVTGIGLLHGISAEHDHLTLWLGWWLLVFLCLSGYIMKRQGADKPGAKMSRWIHGQHLVSILMVILLLLGHALVED